MSPVGYADGISAPALPQDQAPAPSATSSTIKRTRTTRRRTSTPSISRACPTSVTRSGSSWTTTWISPRTAAPRSPSRLLPVDPIGPNSLPFTRSQFDPSTGTSASNPRQQVNAVTSFLDLSQVYGSDEATADALRTHVGGQLKTSPGDLLPYDNATYFTAHSWPPSINLWAACRMKAPCPPPTSS